jgi:hypothetical protein
VGVSRLPEDGYVESNRSTAPADLLSGILSDVALEALKRLIESVVEREIPGLVQKELGRAQLTPWLDTKQAAAYLGITENALRLRQRAGLVKAHRDPAGRLRFHRDDLDRAMSPEPEKRRRRVSRSVRYSGRPT